MKTHTKKRSTTAKHPVWGGRAKAAHRLPSPKTGDPFEEAFNLCTGGNISPEWLVIDGILWEAGTPLPTELEDSPTIKAIMETLK